MKLRKHIYIEETLLEQIEVDNKANFSLYISNLINEDLINMRKSKNELDQNEKNIKYLLNHLNTQNQVLMNFYTDVLVPDLSIKEIKLANSDKLFYEVKCTAGAHAKLEGYWLVGKKNGEWTVFISMDNLKSFGINPDKYYNMNNKIVNGKLIINCFHLEVPEGKSMAKGKKIDDCYIKVDWDNNKQTFRIY